MILAHADSPETENLTSALKTRERDYLIMFIPSYWRNNDCIWFDRKRMARNRMGEPPMQEKVHGWGKEMTVGEGRGGVIETRAEATASHPMTDWEECRSEAFS